MHTITTEQIDGTLDEINDITDQAAATEISEAFTKAQPALAEFVLISTEELSPEAHEMAYFMALVIFHTYSKIEGVTIPAITPEQVIACHDKMDAEFEALQEAHPRFLERVAGRTLQRGQFAVMEYIVTGVMEAAEDGVHLTEEEEGALFSTLKVVADCLEDGYLTALQGAAS